MGDSENRVPSTSGQSSSSEEEPGSPSGAEQTTSHSVRNSGNTDKRSLNPQNSEHPTKFPRFQAGAQSVRTLKVTEKDPIISWEEIMEFYSKPWVPELKIPDTSDNKPKRRLSASNSQDLPKAKQQKLTTETIKDENIVITKSQDIEFSASSVLSEATNVLELHPTKSGDLNRTDFSESESTFMMNEAVECTDTSRDELLQIQNVSVVKSENNFESCLTVTGSTSEIINTNASDEADREKRQFITEPEETDQTIETTNQIEVSLLEIETDKMAKTVDKCEELLLKIETVKSPESITESEELLMETETNKIVEIISECENLTVEKECNEMSESAIENVIIGDESNSHRQKMTEPEEALQIVETKTQNEASLLEIETSKMAETIGVGEELLLNIETMEIPESITDRELLLKTETNKLSKTVSECEHLIVKIESNELLETIIRSDEINSDHQNITESEEVHPTVETTTQSEVSILENETNKMAETISKCEELLLKIEKVKTPESIENKELLQDIETSGTSETIAKCEEFLRESKRKEMSQSMTSSQESLLRDEINKMTETISKLEEMLKETEESKIIVNAATREELIETETNKMSKTISECKEMLKEVAANKMSESSTENEEQLLEKETNKIIETVDECEEILREIDANQSLETSSEEQCLPNSSSTELTDINSSDDQGSVSTESNKLPMENPGDDLAYRKEADIKLNMRNLGECRDTRLENISEYEDSSVNEAESQSSVENPSSYGGARPKKTPEISPLQTGVMFLEEPKAIRPSTLDLEMKPTTSDSASFGGARPKVSQGKGAQNINIPCPKDETDSQKEVRRNVKRFFAHYPLTRILLKNLDYEKIKTSKIFDDGFAIKYGLGKSGSSDAKSSSDKRGQDDLMTKGVEMMKALCSYSQEREAQLARSTRQILDQYRGFYPEAVPQSEAGCSRDSFPFEPRPDRPSQAGRNAGGDGPDLRCLMRNMTNLQDQLQSQASDALTTLSQLGVGADDFLLYCTLLGHTYHEDADYADTEWFVDMDPRVEDALNDVVIHRGMREVQQMYRAVMKLKLAKIPMLENLRQFSVGAGSSQARIEDPSSSSSDDDNAFMEG